MNRLNRAFEVIMRLGRMQKLILASALFGGILVSILGLATIDSSDYIPLYKNLSKSDAGRVELALTSAGYRVLVSGDGETVNVLASDIASARMTLAESGISINAEMGWELFDEQSGIAMNSFLQKVNRLRAMEGELARSIQTLDGIQSARVHLVLPEREAFSRVTPEPRASVILRSFPGTAITQKQAIAVRNLISSSVPQLKLGQVTVLSASGEVLLAEESTSSGEATLQSAKTAIEDRLSREVERILTARVGAGNARVRVNVELSNRREKTTQQSYDPDQQVIRRSVSKNEDRAGAGHGGNVGVENNIPSALAENETAGSSESQSLSGETLQYEIGNIHTETFQEAGEIKRISIAVLVNGIFTVDGSNVNYSDREAEEMVRLTQLVKSAVGYSESRGDAISVDSFRFMDYSMEVGQPISLSIVQQIGRSSGAIIRGLITLAIIAIVMIFGVKPTLRFISETQQIDDKRNSLGLTNEGNASGEIEANSFGAEAGSRNDAGSSQPVNSKPNSSRQQILDPERVEPQNGFIEKNGVEGRIMARQVEAIQGAAVEKPEEVLRVLRSWLGTEATT
jgi:flagellar M-ring protein FliF